MSQVLAAQCYGMPGLVALILLAFLSIPHPCERTTVANVLQVLDFFSSFFRLRGVFFPRVVALAR